MSIKKKGDAIKGITRRTKVVNGREYVTYDVYLGTDHSGRKIRTSKPSEKEARQYVDMFYAQYRETGDISTTSLSQKDLYEFSESRRLLGESNIDMPLQEIIRHYISSVGCVTSKSLSEAYREYYASYPDEQAVHKDCIRLRVGRWVSACGASNLCSSVLLRDVEDYIRGRFEKSSVKTRNNHLSYIKSFFEWCVHPSRRYMAQNPLKDLRLQKIAYKEPEYMKVGDVAKLFDMLSHKRHELVTYATLSWFCGIRNAEIGRLGPSDIKLEDGIVRISRPKGWTQGMMPRVVNIPENALDWLLRHDVLSHLEKMRNTENIVTCIYQHGARNGLIIPKNAGRHSFITHHAAAYGEPAKTEAMAGTSQRMRVFHYQGLVSRKDGERYFAIVP